MKKTLWISGLFMFVFLVFSINTTQAQQTIISENDALMNNAKDRYEQFFDVTLTENEFEAAIAPTQQNLEEWTSILNGFSKAEIRASYGGGTSSNTNTIELDSDNLEEVEYDPSLNPQRTRMVVLDGRPSAFQSVRTIVWNIRKAL